MDTCFGMPGYEIGVHRNLAKDDGRTLLTQDQEPI